MVETELDELPVKAELISTNGLTKDLINAYSTFKGAKYFFSDVLQNYLVFISAEKYIKFLVALKEFTHGNLKESQKKVLKILLD